MRSGILGHGYYVPERIVTNADLEKIVDTSDAWIVERTGIKERRYMADEQASSDMAYEAARSALEKSGLEPEDIDLIMVATVSPDMLFPSVACLIQDRLGCVHAAAFDLEAACSGFLYGLHLADALIQSGKHHHVLVVGVESLTKLTDFTDRNTCVLFGDGAGAVVMGKVEQGGILATTIGADGSGGDYLNLPAGGSRLGVSHQTIEQGLHYIKMAGREVFKFAVRKMKDASVEAIEKAGLTPSDIQYLVPHQANLRIIEAAAKRLELPLDKVKVNLDRFGNMSSASIPVAMSEALDEGSIRSGDKVVLVGFGGGLTWGAAVIEF